MTQLKTVIKLSKSMSVSQTYAYAQITCSNKLVLERILRLMKFESTDIIQTEIDHTGITANIEYVAYMIDMLPDLIVKVMSKHFTSDNNHAYQLEFE